MPLICIREVTASSLVRNIRATGQRLLRDLDLLFCHNCSIYAVQSQVIDK